MFRAREWKRSSLAVFLLFSLVVQLFAFPGSLAQAETLPASTVETSSPIETTVAETTAETEATVATSEVTEATVATSEATEVTAPVETSAAPVETTAPSSGSWREAPTTLVQGSEGVFIVERPLADFRGLALNDQALVRDQDYSVKEGSTIIRLSPALTEGLTVGTLYRLTAHFGSTAPLEHSFQLLEKSAGDPPIALRGGAGTTFSGTLTMEGENGQNIVSVGPNKTDSTYRIAFSVSGISTRIPNATFKVWGDKGMISPPKAYMGLQYGGINLNATAPYVASVQNYETATEIGQEVTFKNDILGGQSYAFNEVFMDALHPYLADGTIVPLYAALYAEDGSVILSAEIRVHQVKQGSLSFASKVDVLKRGQSPEQDGSWSDSSTTVHYGGPADPNNPNVIGAQDPSSIRIRYALVNSGPHLADLVIKQPIPDPHIQVDLAKSPGWTFDPTTRIATFQPGNPGYTMDNSSGYLRPLYLTAVGHAYDKPLDLGSPNFTHRLVTQAATETNPASSSSLNSISLGRGVAAVFVGPEYGGAFLASEPRWNPPAGQDPILHRETFLVSTKDTPIAKLNFSIEGSIPRHGTDASKGIRVPHIFFYDNESVNWKISVEDQAGQSTPLQAAQNFSYRLQGNQVLHQGMPGVQLFEIPESTAKIHFEWAAATPIPSHTKKRIYYSFGPQAGVSYQEGDNFEFPVKVPVIKDANGTDIPIVDPSTNTTLDGVGRSLHANVRALRLDLTIDRHNLLTNALSDPLSEYLSLAINTNFSQNPDLGQPLKIVDPVWHLLLPDYFEIKQVVKLAPDQMHVYPPRLHEGTPIPYEMIENFNGTGKNLIRIKGLQLFYGDGGYRLPRLRYDLQAKMGTPNIRGVKEVDVYFSFNQKASYEQNPLDTPIFMGSMPHAPTDPVAEDPNILPDIHGLQEDLTAADYSGPYQKHVVDSKQNKIIGNLGGEVTYHVAESVYAKMTGRPAVAGAPYSSDFAVEEDGAFEYKLDVFNLLDPASVQNFVLINKLPKPNDKVLVANAAGQYEDRGSTFRPVMTGPITETSGKFDISYYVGPQSSFQEGVPIENQSQLTEVAQPTAGQWKDVVGFKIALKANESMPKNSAYAFTIPMQMGSAGEKDLDALARSSFAYRINQGNYVEGQESVVTVRFLAHIISGQVFDDINANGVRERATEEPLGGIQVSLYDQQGQPVIEQGRTISTRTNGRGEYELRFFTPGNYHLRIDGIDVPPYTLDGLTVFPVSESSQYRIVNNMDKVAPNAMATPVLQITKNTAKVFVHAGLVRNQKSLAFTKWWDNLPGKNSSQNVQNIPPILNHVTIYQVGPGTSRTPLPKDKISFVRKELFDYGHFMQVQEVLQVKDLPIHVTNAQGTLEAVRYVMEEDLAAINQAIAGSSGIFREDRRGDRTLRNAFEATTGGHALNYDKNAVAATGTVIDRQSPYANGATATILPNGFYLAGFEFTGWNTQRDGAGTSYQPGDQVVLSAPLTLYAIWRKIPTMSYQVEKTFDNIPANLQLPEIRVVLYRSSQTTAKEAVGPSVPLTIHQGSGSHTWIDLPLKDASGNAYSYHADEANVPQNYEKTLSHDTTAQPPITRIVNRYNPGSFEVSKAFHDNSTDFVADQKEDGLVYRIKVEITEAMKAMGVEITDTLDPGLSFRGTPTVRADANAPVNASHAITGQNLTINVSAAELSKFTSHLTITFLANFAADIDLAKYTDRRVPNEASVAIPGMDGSVKSNTVTASFKIPFTLHKTNLAGDVKLAGASFTLHPENDPADNLELVTNAQGQHTVQGQIRDGRYTLRETKAPEGYQLLQHPLTLSIKDGAVTTVTSSNEASLYTLVTKDNSLVIRNQAVVVEAQQFLIQSTFEGQAPKAGEVASFEIQKASDQTVVQSFSISEAAPNYEVKGLAEGDYRLKPSKLTPLYDPAKDVFVGFGLAEPVAFRIAQDKKAYDMQGKAISLMVVDNKAYQSLFAEKHWQQDKPHLRPRSLTFVLNHASSGQGAQRSVNGGTGWKARFDQLRVNDAAHVPLRYSLDELRVPAGYQKLAVQGQGTKAQPFILVNRYQPAPGPGPRPGPGPGPSPVPSPVLPRGPVMGRPEPPAVAGMPAVPQTGEDRRPTQMLAALFFSAAALLALGRFGKKRKNKSQGLSDHR